MTPSMVPSVVPSVVPNMAPSMTRGETHPPPGAASPPLNEGRINEARRPLAQLLHALNQPLTGLQCSMEVALACPRTPEQYVQGLREGLDLTGRMRDLVQAIREVADLEAAKNDELETIDWKTLLREVVDELKPVAEGKRVRIKPEWSTASSLIVRAGWRRLATLVFQFLESALSLAAPGTELGIEIDTGGASAEPWLRIRWRAERPTSAFSRPELGLLVAQAGWERLGAQWQRERTGSLETVTVRMQGFSACDANSSSPLLLQLLQENRNRIVSKPGGSK